MSSDAADYYASPDWSRAAQLPGSDWWAVVAIEPDGQEALWLVSPTPDEPQGCNCADCAPHDQLNAPDRRAPQETP